MEAAHIPETVIIDLPDDRRAAKTWLPADDRDFTNGLVTAGGDGKPRCSRHGAMNRVDPVRRIYRCQEMYCGVGAEVVPEDSLETPSDDYAVTRVRLPASHGPACVQ